MALLGSFAFLFLYVIGHKGKYKRQSFQLLKYTATLLLITGYIGSQSRNMCFTLICGIIFTIYFKISFNQNAVNKLLLFDIVILGCILFIAFFSFFEVSMIELLREFGGTKEASATVDFRTLQYSLAWKLFKTNPYFGQAIEILNAKIEIHNIWLKLMALGGIVSTTAVAFIFLVPFTSLIRNSNLCAIRQERIFALTQLVCMFVAAEFYGAMSYVFFVVLGTLAIIPSLLKIESKRWRSLSTS
jgi:O-antigen ligase